MNAIHDAERIPLDPPSGEDFTQVTRRQPQTTLSVNDLQHHLFKPRTSRHPMVRSAYELWRDEWRVTLSEADGVTRIHSDEFVRQDEISVLSIGTRCVSITALRWIDLAEPIGREDSYFQLWPDHPVQLLGETLVGISSNTLVHPEWRSARIAPDPGQGEPLSLSFTTVALAIRRFMDSAASSVLGVTRNTRSMNRVAAGVGAVKLGETVVHGEESDLICITRAAAKTRGAVLDPLWERRHQE